MDFRAPHPLVHPSHAGHPYYYPGTILFHRMECFLSTLSNVFNMIWYFSLMKNRLTWIVFTWMQYNWTRFKQTPIGYIYLGTVYFGQRSLGHYLFEHRLFKYRLFGQNYIYISLLIFIYYVYPNSTYILSILNNVFLYVQMNVVQLNRAHPYVSKWTRYLLCSSERCPTERCPSERHTFSIVSK